MDGTETSAEAPTHTPIARGDNVSGAPSALAARGPTEASKQAVVREQAQQNAKRSSWSREPEVALITRPSSSRSLSMNASIELPAEEAECDRMLESPPSVLSALRFAECVESLSHTKAHRISENQFNVITGLKTV